jgi:hypothetical protein
MIYGRPIFVRTILDSDLKDDIIHLSNFSMHRPENADVYKLFDIHTEKKIGIAYIPDTQTSKKCKQWFNKKSVKTLIVKCKLDIEKNKWIPIEPVDDTNIDVGKNKILAAKKSSSQSSSDEDSPLERSTEDFKKSKKTSGSKSKKTSGSKSIKTSGSKSKKTSGSKSKKSSRSKSKKSSSSESD